MSGPRSGSCGDKSILIPPRRNAGGLDKVIFINWIHVVLSQGREDWAGLKALMSCSYNPLGLPLCQTFLEKSKKTTTSTRPLPPRAQRLSSYGQNLDLWVNGLLVTAALPPSKHRMYDKGLPKKPALLLALENPPNFRDMNVDGTKTGSSNLLHGFGHPPVGPSVASPDAVSGTTRGTAVYTRWQY